ncbi:MAG: flagellar hook-basal body protein [Anaerolineae bacterium]
MVTAISAMHVLRVGASTMLAHEQALDVVSNNMANANTVGYAPSRVEFKELLQGQLEEEASGVAVSTIRHLWRQGAIKPTGRDLDLAIRGEGFLQISLPDGRTGYTRSGALQRGANGAIATADGYSLYQPITVPETVDEFRLSDDGIVTVRAKGSDEWTEAGRITLATFPNREGLEHVGKGIYVAGVASGEATVSAPGEGPGGAIVVGALEESSVAIGDEMVDLLTAQRLYSLGVKIVQTADEMQSLANQLIGR